jgi:hypothetical protein
MQMIQELLTNGVASLHGLPDVRPSVPAFISYVNPQGAQVSSPQSNRAPGTSDIGARGGPSQSYMGGFSAGAVGEPSSAQGYPHYEQQQQQQQQYQQQQGYPGYPSMQQFPGH